MVSGIFSGGGSKLRRESRFGMGIETGCLDETLLRESRV